MCPCSVPQRRTSCGFCQESDCRENQPGLWLQPPARLCTHPLPASTFPLWTLPLTLYSMQSTDPPADSHSLSSNLESKEGQEKIQEGCVTWLPWLPCLSCGPGSQVTQDSTDRCGTVAWLRPVSGVCPCPLGCGRAPLPFRVVLAAYPSQASTEPLPPISSSSGRGAVPAISQRQSVLT